MIVIIDEAALKLLEARLKCDAHDCMNCLDEWRRDVPALIAAIRERDAEVTRLLARQQELRAALVKVTNTTPFADEAKDALEQRGKLLWRLARLLKNGPPIVTAAQGPATITLDDDTEAV